MLRTILRVLSAGLAAQGAFMVWIARYGTLWAYETDLGWFAPYVLRPGMYAIGSFSVVFGLWYAWLAYTTGGRVLTTWADDIRHDLAAGAVADLGWCEVVRLYALELTYRRGCLIGRHDLAAVTYIPREGYVCENCGLAVPMRMTPYDRLDSFLAGHVPALWRWMHRKEIARGDWLPGDEQQPSRMRRQGYDKLIGIVKHDTFTLVPTPADLLRAQAGRCAEAGLHETAAELRDEAERLDGGVNREDRCFVCYRPISEHDVGQYDDECPDYMPRRASCDKEG